MGFNVMAYLYMLDFNQFSVILSVHNEEGFLPNIVLVLVETVVLGYINMAVAHAFDIAECYKEMS